MSLTAGSRLGRYEIQSPLGAGGMGEVYLARDLRLDRAVALKVLTPGIAGDGEFRERFLREAKAIAAFQHPGICVLHDVAEDGGIAFLVMEHLDGETLAARLKQGALPMTEVVRLGREIASALAAAHRQGFIHRDLKPANIMLTGNGALRSGTSRAKLLDFGLAKPVAASKTTLAHSTPMTTPGAILGTLAYMAPEQLQGREADARSDIFSLGAVLFEMATGKMLAADASSAALDRVQAPPLLIRIIRKCVEPDPDNRWQSAADLVDPLQWSEDARLEAAAPAASAGDRRRWFAWVGGALVAGAALAALAMNASRATPATPRSMRVDVLAPRGTTFTPRDRTWHPQFAISPDGAYLAFVASEPRRPPQLWLRSLETGASRPLLGTEYASGPFWSPDSQSIGFFAQGRLKKTSLGGSSPQDLAPVAIDVVGGSWSTKGAIIFSGSVGDRLFTVRAEGGPVTPVTTLDVGREESGHRWPQFLPDGRRFIYYARSSIRGNTGVYAGALDSTEKQQLLQANFSAAYAEPGFLLYSDRGNLVSRPFDVTRGTLVGEPVNLGDRVFGFSGSGYLPVSVADNGTVAYWNGRPPPAELIWFNRKGEAIRALSGREAFDNPVLANNASAVLVTKRTEENRNELWRIDATSGSATQISFSTPVGGFPVWAPDSRRFVYSAVSDEGAPQLRVKAVVGADEEVALLSSPRRWALLPEDWSRDGRWLLYTVTETTGWDVGVFDRQTGKSIALMTSPANEVQPRFSPDGRWIAYTTDESGSWKVCVRPFTTGTTITSISPEGGSHPQWRGDGKELFFITADGQLAVSTITSDPFEASAPTHLFQTRISPMLAPYRTAFGVSPDGQSFLISNVAPESESSAITLVIPGAAGPGRR